MKSLNAQEVSQSPLVQNFTQEVFEAFYNVDLVIPKKYVIDTGMVPKVKPEVFRKSIIKNSPSKTKPLEEGRTYYVEGRPRVIDGMLKLKNILGDPSVMRIECPGPNAPLTIIRRDVKQITRISLTKEASQSNDTNLVEQLKSLNDLYKSGVLTKEEFERTKKKLLN